MKAVLFQTRVCVCVCEADHLETHSNHSEETVSTLSCKWLRVVWQVFACLVRLMCQQNLVNSVGAFLDVM